MTYGRKILVLAVMLPLCVVTLRAGDSASFVDLGFSPDGDIYMFSQYGVKADSLKPWADLFVVDVARNDFVSGGRISYIHNAPITAGQDGAGAMYRLIAQNADLAGRYNVTYPGQGQPLYVALDGDPAWAGDTISFRDFVSSVSYQATLVETINGGAEQSSFYIRLECADGNGGEKSFVIGDPGIKRSLVFSYRIKKVLTSPSGGSLVFVIEMKRRAPGGHDIRYMIEALRF